MIPKTLSGPTQEQVVAIRRQYSYRGSWRTCIVRAYNCCIWALLGLLLFVQVLAVVWNSTTCTQRVVYGNPPDGGVFQLPGANDEPYADRIIACATQGRRYVPIQLSRLLKKGALATNGVRYSSNGIDGYRVVSRNIDSLHGIRAENIHSYVLKCETLFMTIEQILDACGALGYNVTRDVLRIVAGLDTEEVSVFSNVLPVLFLPIWDVAFVGRYIVPGLNGSAGVFRGSGQFDDDHSNFAYISATPRDIRESKTKEWLKSSRGKWRNGWFEDSTTGMGWHSEIAN